MRIEEEIKKCNAACASSMLFKGFTCLDANKSTRPCKHLLCASKSTKHCFLALRNLMKSSILIVRCKLLDISKPKESHSRSKIAGSEDNVYELGKLKA